MTSSPAPATEITGICIYVCAPGDDANQCAPDSTPSSIAWHTALDDVAAPIALTRSLPWQSYRVPLLSGPLGGIDRPLAPGKHIFTALWQPPLGDFPLRVAFNLFFNRDNVNPGIAAIAPTWGGLSFTNFRANLSANTYSLFLKTVPSPASLEYSDARNSVTLTALLVAHSSSFAPVDRVGLQKLGKDRAKDAIAIFELTVNAIVRTPGPTLGPTVPPPSPRVVAPPEAIVGPDESVVEERGGLLPEATPSARPAAAGEGDATATPTALRTAGPSDLRTASPAVLTTRTASPHARTATPHPVSSPATPASTTPARVTPTPSR